MKKKFLLAIISIIAAGSVSAQVYVKSNALLFALAVPNLGFEFGLGDHSTLSVEGYVSPFWEAEKLTFKGFVVTPEYRYYFCEAFNGHYLGVHGNYTQYDALKTLNSPVYRDGYSYGAGLTYGHTWKLSHKWIVDAFIGAGWMRFDSDIVESSSDVVHKTDVVEDKFFLDRAGVSVGYRF
ncbi:MAG: DUF3575 domain-containing protein [Rikenellaceae bacterium]